MCPSTPPGPQGGAGSGPTVALLQSEEGNEDTSGCIVIITIMMTKAAIICLTLIISQHRSRIHILSHAMFMTFRGGGQAG